MTKDCETTRLRDYETGKPEIPKSRSPEVKN